MKRNSRIVEDTQIVFIKVWSYCEYFRTNLYRIDLFKGRECERTAGNAGSKAHEENPLAGSIKKKRQNALQTVHFNAPFNGSGRLHPVNP